MRAQADHRSGPGQRPHPLLPDELLWPSFFVFLAAYSLGWMSWLTGAKLGFPRLLVFGQALSVSTLSLTCGIWLIAFVERQVPRRFARNNRGGAGSAIAILLVLLFIGIFFFELGGWLWVQHLLGL